MAFHVACSLTCRPICYCPHGTPAELQSSQMQSDFLQKAASLALMWENPQAYLHPGGTTEVLVPHVQHEVAVRGKRPPVKSVDQEQTGAPPFKPLSGRRKLPPPPPPPAVVAAVPGGSPVGSRAAAPAVGSPGMVRGLPPSARKPKASAAAAELAPQEDFPPDDDRPHVRDAHSSCSDFLFFKLK
eukprot:jgi/Mesen1/7962/ME000422S07114